MGKEIKTTMRIEKIQKTRTQTKNKDKEIYSLLGKDSDGTGTIKVNLPHNFDGFGVDTVVDITITSSQTSLEDFEAPNWKETDKGKKKSVAIAADKAAKTKN